jgi:hypothetical protein
VSKEAAIYSKDVTVVRYAPIQGYAMHGAKADLISPQCAFSRNIADIMKLPTGCAECYAEEKLFADLIMTLHRTKTTSAQT